MLATEEGYLGSFSKVSTASLPFTVKTSIHAICVYTYDRHDREDILRIREALCELGIEQKGCIACLLALYQIAPSAQTLEVAIHCGEHLLSNAKKLAGGLAGTRSGR